jgi:hypothetical protein
MSWFPSIGGLMVDVGRVSHPANRVQGSDIITEIVNQIIQKLITDN